MYCADCGGTGAADSYECGGCWGAGWVDTTPCPGPAAPKVYERDRKYVGITASEAETLDALKWSKP